MRDKSLNRILKLSFPVSLECRPACKCNVGDLSGSLGVINSQYLLLNVSQICDNMSCFFIISRGLYRFETFFWILKKFWINMKMIIQTRDRTGFRSDPIFSKGDRSDPDPIFSKGDRYDSDPIQFFPQVFFFKFFDKITKKINLYYFKYQNWRNYI